MKVMLSDAIEIADRLPSERIRSVLIGDAERASYSEG